MAKFLKIGAVLRNDNGKPFMVTGDPKNRNKKFQYQVELVVRDGDGKEVMRTTNPLLSLFDPRSRPGITEEELAKVSDKLRFEVCLKSGE